MTVLQAAYADERANGRAHHAALRALSERFDLDAGTIGRVLARAEGDDVKRRHQRRQQQRQEGT
jgi:hypothetical protein